MQHRTITIKLLLRSETKSIKAPKYHYCDRRIGHVSYNRLCMNNSSLNEESHRIAVLSSSST